MRSRGVTEWLGLCLLVTGLAVSGAAEARSHRRVSHAASYRHRALPYNPRVPPTYTAYTPPGATTTTSPAAPPPPPLCAGSFFAPRAPFARRVWRWTVDTPPQISPAPAPTQTHSINPCAVVGPLLRGLAALAPGTAGPLGAGFASGEWRCAAAAHALTCFDRRAPGFPFHARPAALLVGRPVHAGGVLGDGLPGMSVFASADYYDIALPRGGEVLTPGAPVRVKYFMVIGRHRCGVSAGGTEQTMAHAGGVILAVASSTAEYFARPLYLRLPSSPAYRACLFLQQSGADARAAALIQVPF